MADVTTTNLKTEGGLKPTAISSKLQLPTSGLIVIEPFASMIVDGEKTILVKSRPYKIYGKKYLLITRDKALGTVVLSKYTTVNLTQFKSLEKEHKISETTRKKFWNSKTKLYAYKILSLKVFATPIPIERISGSHIIAHDIALKIEKSPTTFELSKADSKSLANFSAWLNVLASKTPAWSKSILRFIKKPSDTVKAINGFADYVNELVATINVSGGEANDDASFPESLASAIKWGKIVSRSLKEVERLDLSNDINDALKELEKIDKIMDQVIDAEDLESL